MVAINKKSLPFNEPEEYRISLFKWKFSYFHPLFILPKEQRGNNINIVNHFERMLKTTSWMNEKIEEEVYGIFNEFNKNKNILVISKSLYEISYKSGMIGGKEFEKMKYISENLNSVDIYQKSAYAYVSFCLYISFNHGIKPLEVHFY